MVRKLTNSQISESWEDLKPALIQSTFSTPVDAEAQLSELFERLLLGEAQLWVGLVDTTIVCLCATFIGVHILNNKKELVIAGLYGYAPIPNNVWKDLRDMLVEYAKDLGCTQMTAYTKNPRVIQVASQAGADVETRFIRWSI